MKKVISIFLTMLLVLMTVAIPVASAWNASPAAGVDMTLKLIGMMNVNIFGDTNTISNVNTVADGSVVSGVTLYAKKFGGTWPHQVGDGPYTESQIETLFATDAITDCMTAEQNELAVYMLYDLGNPENDTVKENMRILGIDDINLYYQLMSEKIQLTIDAIAGGGKGHETAITAYYRYSSDWRNFAKGRSSATRSEMLSLGIAAPDENVYFYETKESQLMRDGSDSIPGINDESVSQYIDENESYSLPVWEDTDEDASWNIVNPVPTCNIYSRWYDDFSAESNYETCYNMRESKIIELYGEDYTIGQFNAVTGDAEKDNVMFAKNWEWEENPYYSTKTSGVYGTTSADKSHLGYGEYCPASVVSYHNFTVPQNTANDDAPSRFMTVMVRETGTVCGLDGCGHWHTVKVSAVSKSLAAYFQPEINDDAVVIDYGLSVDIPVDANDWVWTTDPYASTNVYPNIDRIEITAGSPDDTTGWSTTSVTGKYGILELTDWSNQWGEGHCNVRYTPKIFVEEPDVFYYKVYPVDSEKYVPLTGKITVIPATLVYYEDNFSANDSGENSGFTSSLIYSGNWSYVNSDGQVISGTAVNGTQSAVNKEYGYDSYYDDDLGFSDGSAHQGKLGDTLNFTFLGTGCDIIMRSDAADGSVKYSVTKSATKGGVQTEATSQHTVSCRNNNGTTLYQLPVISLRYDEYAYYTVSVSGITTRNIYIDGIRIYNPLGIYGQDTADNDTMDTYYDTAENPADIVAVYDAIYDSQSTESGKFGFIGVYSNWNEWYGTEKNYEGEETDFSSLLSIGPNNEIYLAPGQSIVFNVQNTNYDNLILGVEAKAVSDPTTISMTVDGDSTSLDCRTVATNTAMYYHYMIKNTQIGQTGTVRIENSGSNILSISNLKYSRILAVSGTFEYRFIDTTGVPVGGVTVKLYDSAGTLKAVAVSDENGIAKITDAAAGDYKVHFTVPEGKSSVATRKASVSGTSTGDAATFVLYDCILGIGTDAHLYMTPAFVSDARTIEFTNTATGTHAGSYVINYTFDGVSGGSGYADKNNYLNGTLSLTVDDTGKVNVKFTGSGKSNGKSFSSAKGTLPAGTAQFTGTGMTIDFNAVMQLISGYAETNTNFGFKNVSLLFSQNSVITLQAFENTDPAGEGVQGSVASITIGAESTYSATTSATAVFTVTDNAGNPVADTVITADDGTTATTGDDGIATMTGITYGDRIFTVNPPANYDRVEQISASLDPVNNSVNAAISVYPLATAEFYFTLPDGTPAAGVTVTTDDGVTFVSDENGRAYSDEINYGDRVFSFTVPSGYSKIASESITLTHTDNAVNESIALRDINLTIGSYDTSTYTTATIGKPNLTLQNFRTVDAAGSYLITYEFDGTAGGTGYIDTKSYISGTLSVLVNADGTASYVFEGSGLTNKKPFSSSSGTTNAVTLTDNTITIDMVTLLKTATGISGTDFKFTTPSAYITTGSVVGITACEYVNGAGVAGDTAPVTVGTETATSLADRIEAVIIQLRATFERFRALFRSIFGF